MTMDMDSPPHPFKVFGLQRTGTNLMRALLSRNFCLEYLEESDTGWKHGPSRMTDGTWKGRPVRFVLCVKNPYAWASSCHRFFRRVCDGDVTMAPQFQRDPSMSFDEFMMTPTYTYDTPVHRWNEMNRLWLDSLPTGRTLVVRQEDLLLDQTQVLRRAQQQLQLTPNGEKLQSIDQRIDVDASVKGEMNREYYLHREYLAEYSPSLLDHVNRLLDSQLMNRLGYEIERWPLTEREINGVRIVVRPCTSDAAQVREMTLNPYRLDPIAHSAIDIKTVVDFDAGVGGWTLLAKMLWPNCRLWTCEPYPQKLKVLRVNVRRLPNVTVVGAESADIEELLKRCGSVDLLRLGSAQSAPQMIESLIGAGTIKNLFCVCGALPAGYDAENLFGLVARTHAVEAWKMPSALFFRADRVASVTSANPLRATGVRSPTILR
jgi:hypothetical protein